MNRMIPLSAAAGVLACVLAAGSAQAAPVASGMLDKLAAVNNGTSAVEQVHWRRHHRWWRYRYYRRHCGWRCRHRWWY